ncbi:hypothetical protein BDR22DRAFT_920679 [Usnea florida]
MATLSQFPNEMITCIWEYILEPQDVESFALVSKHIYAIGAPFVAEQNKLKRENSSFILGSFIEDTAPTLLLKKILLWPRVALYVTHLFIGALRTRWDTLGDDVDVDEFSYHIAYPADDMELFIEAIRKADLVPRNEIDDWVTAVKDGDETPIMALLLLLLPNLCTMTLEIQSESYCQLTKTFQLMSETKNSPFLTRLTTVNLSFYPQSKPDFTDWRWLGMSATLPSVQSIHVKDLHSVSIKDLIKYGQYFRNGNSTIKELAFTDSSICPKSMFQLFASIKGLKKFMYSNPYDEPQSFEPFWMGKALTAYTENSLESLKITTKRHEGVETLGSFRGFTNLRELETEVHLLVEKGRFHGLADLLPVSIEKVILYTGYRSNCDSVLLIIEAFDKAKSQLLPNMRMLTLILEPGTELSQEEKELLKTSEENCWNLGIELSVIKREDDW